MSNVKFAHYRRFNKDGVPTSNYGATVAYMVGPTGSNFAIAFCGPHDNYSKSLGRAKAGGRLLSETYAESGHHTDNASFLTMMDERMDHMIGYYRNADASQAAALRNSLDAIDEDVLHVQV